MLVGYEDKDMPTLTKRILKASGRFEGSDDSAPAATIMVINATALTAGFSGFRRWENLWKGKARRNFVIATVGPARKHRSSRVFTGPRHEGG